MTTLENNGGEGGGAPARYAVPSPMTYMYITFYILFRSTMFSDFATIVFSVF